MLDLAKSTVFFRNTFIPFTDANLSIASSPVMYGLSVYTVFGVNNGPDGKLFIFRLPDHYKRLVNSAKILDLHGFLDEWTYEKFQSTMTELIKKNDIKEDALVRVYIFLDELMAGTKIHNIKNSLCAFVYPVGEYFPSSGINVCVSSWQRTPDNAVPARAKINGSYANSALMKNEALLNGYDDAIALDEHGHVSESTVANLFLIRDGILVTPDDSTDLLEGITRSCVLSLAEKHKLPVTQRTIDRSELYIADEAFVCGSSALITPVLSIDKRLVGNGKPGPHTTKLSEAYKAAQHGTSPDFAEWRLGV